MMMLKWSIVIRLITIFWILCSVLVLCRIITDEHEEEEEQQQQEGSLSPSSGSSSSRITKWEDVYSQLHQTNYMQYIQLAGGEGILQSHPKVQEIDQEIQDLMTRRKVMMSSPTLGDDTISLDDSLTWASLLHRRSRVLHLPHDMAQAFYLYENILDNLRPTESLSGNHDTLADDDEWRDYCLVLVEFSNKLLDSEIYSDAYSVIQEIDNYYYCRDVKKAERVLIKAFSLSRLNRYGEVITLYQNEMMNSVQDDDDANVRYYCAQFVQELETAFAANSNLFEVDNNGISWFKEAIDDCFSNTVELISSTDDTNHKHRLQLELKRVYRAYFQYYEKMKDYPKAWHYLELFHSTTEKLKHYDFDGSSSNDSNLLHFVTSYYDKIQTIRGNIHHIKPAPLSSSPEKNNNIQPIFIVGFPRSGSTLVESILGAHSNIGPMGEESTFGAIAKHLIEVLTTKGGEGAATISMKNLFDHISYITIPTLLEGLKERYRLISRLQNQQVRSSADTAAENDVLQSQSDDDDKFIFVDKALTNIVYVGLIDVLFPNALIIHVARNPMDHLFGVYKKFFADSSMEYVRCFKLLFRGYKSYRDIMDYWDEVLPPGRVLHVRYEELVQDVAGISKAIIEQAHLPWDEGILDFYKKKRAVNNASRAQVRKGVYTSSIDNWKRYENYLEPLKDIIGSYVNYNLTTRIGDYRFSDDDVDEDSSSKEEEQEL